jgi:hypothetical protein
MKNKIKNGLLIYLSVFVIFFLLRFFYGLVEKEGMSVYNPV